MIFCNAMANRRYWRPRGTLAFEISQSRDWLDLSTARPKLCHAHAAPQPASEIVHGLILPTISRRCELKIRYKVVFAVNHFRNGTA